MGLSFIKIHIFVSNFAHSGLTHILLPKYGRMIGQNFGLSFHQIGGRSPNVLSGALICCYVEDNFLPLPQNEFSSAQIGA
jgi:hypothetical protein